jgi:biotin transport system substrate-specific component
MSSTTLALAASPSGARSKVAWRVLLAIAGSWLVAGLAQIEIKLPFTPVPITGQTLGVLLVGASLGAGLGGVSMALYLSQGAIGLPFFSGGDSGAELLRLSAVTGGYLWGFVLSAAVVGWLAERGWDRSIRSSIGAMFLGEVVLYLVAIPWLMQALDVSLGEALELGLAPFVVGDTLKLLLAAGLLPLGWRFVRRERRPGQISRRSRSTNSSLPSA